MSEPQTDFIREFIKQDLAEDASLASNALPSGANA